MKTEQKIAPQCQFWSLEHSPLASRIHDSVDILDVYINIYIVDIKIRYYIGCYCLSLLHIKRQFFAALSIYPRAIIIGLRWTSSRIDDAVRVRHFCTVARFNGGNWIRMTQHLIRNHFCFRTKQKPNLTNHLDLHRTMIYYADMALTTCDSCALMCAMARGPLHTANTFHLHKRK